MQELDILAKNLDASRAALREAKREALQRATESALAEVRSRIGGTGRVQSWQEARMGSGGGYGATSAKAGLKDAHGYRVGLVTSAIEHGHVVGKKWSLEENLRHTQIADRQSRVVGKYMYAHTDAERYAAQAAEEIERAMDKKLRELTT